MAPRTTSAPVADRHRAPRRRLPAAERRLLILEAALRALAANGYEGAAMDEIAAGAGISKAVVYDHVDSKQELYSHLLDAIRDEVMRTVHAALRAPGDDGADRVQAAADAVYRYVEEQPEASRLLLRELQGPTVSPTGRDLKQRLNAGIARTLETELELFAGHADRALQLEILAELLKSAVIGLSSWWYRNPHVPRGHLVERTVALVWPALERAQADTAAAG
jgi:AcrR family transcriptional regulator